MKKVRVVSCVLLSLLAGCASQDQSEKTQAEYLALVKSTNEAESKADATAKTATAAVAGAQEEKTPGMVEVSDENLSAMARHMAADMPNAPRVDTRGGPARITLDQSYFTLENGLVMDKVLFTHRLLAEFKKTRARQLEFSDQRSNSGLGGGSSRGSSKKSSSSGNTGGSYRLEGTFTSLPPAADQFDAQTYEFRLVDTNGSNIVWMGNFDISTPLSAVEQPAKK